MIAPSQLQPPDGAGIVPQQAFLMKTMGNIEQKKQIYMGQCKLLTILKKYPADGGQLESRKAGTETGTETRKGLSKMSSINVR